MGALVLYIQRFPTRVSPFGEGDATVWLLPDAAAVSTRVASAASAIEEAAYGGRWKKEKVHLRCRR